MIKFEHIKATFYSALACFSVLFLLLGSEVIADVPEDQVEEVNHLISFVRTSNCVLNRNGTEHSAEKSTAHIEKKYNYFRDRIKSTEDFIKYSATKSTMSGKYYTVICPDREAVKSSDWLLEELSRFRSSKTSGGLTKTE